MRFSPTVATIAASIGIALCRRLYSAAELPKLSKIPARYRRQAIEDAGKALTEYLHSTRALPFTYAEHISRNALVSLSDVISRVKYSPSTLFSSLQRYLRYHPINEFEFFYESIGIHYDQIKGFLPPNKFFLSDDLRVLDVACALSVFGFPWSSLGKLYREEISIFSRDPSELSDRLHGFKEDLGFSTATVVGVCLVFPYVLNDKSDRLSGEISALFDDLGKLFADLDLGNCVEGNVDDWVGVCRKIKVFYDLGCRKGKLGELMAKSKFIFLQYPEEVLVDKVDFFCRLGVNKSDVGLLLLERPEILDLEFKDQVVSVLGILKHLDISTKELKSISQSKPHFLGRNKMVNLPHVMRALDLHEWFFNKMRNGKHFLLGTYIIGNEEDLDKDYQCCLDMIHQTRTAVHTLNKLNFLHGIGFGENSLTIKLFANLHGTSAELQERFDCLLRTGIKYSSLCRMVTVSPKFLNQDVEILEQKVKFLCEEVGSSLEHLEVFPAFLCYDLEKRIKPRYRFHMWLTKNGFCAKSYSIASMIATSEKNFIARISKFHPDAPKLWLEQFKQIS